MSCTATDPASVISEPISGRGTSLRRRERGQTLVIVALMLVALIAMLALVIDIGMAYAQRRTMQNAADAGALAGARVLALAICPGQAFDSGAAEAAAKAAACQYAELNGAAAGDCAPEVIYGTRPEYAEPIPITVTVLVSERVPTYFASVIGVPHVDVSAFAASAWMAASAGTDFIPLTLRDTTWLSDTETPYQIYSSDREPLSPTMEGDLGQSMRGWLNFGEAPTEDTSNPDSANELKCWSCDCQWSSCAKDCAKPTVNLTTTVDCTDCAYVEGSSGVNNTVLGSMIDCGLEGANVLVPIFDISLDKTKGQYVYRIVGFAEFHITDIVDKGNPKYMQGYFVKRASLNSSMTGDPEAKDYGVHTVRLVR